MIFSHFYGIINILKMIGEIILNIGYIYKITNLINQKVYIGQTSKPYNTRWNEHKSYAFNENKESYNYPLYKAFRKYGIENFKFEVVEECEIKDLDDKEIFYIEKYSSSNNKYGYNQSLGGKGFRLHNLNEEFVVEKYKELGTILDVCNFFNCTHNVIDSILIKHNVNVKSAIEHQKEKGNKIFQYDLNGNLINTFNSRVEVGEWLVKNNFNNGKNAKLSGDNFRSKFRFKDEFILFDYLWKIEKPYNKQVYINLQKERAKIDKIKKKHLTDKCPLCGKLKSKKALKCVECNNIERLEIGKNQREEKYKITRNELKCKIRHMSFLQIGNEYGVSDNAIRKWCKSYNLPFKTREIKSYSDEEWEKL